MWAYRTRTKGRRLSSRVEVEKVIVAGIRAAKGIREAAEEVQATIAREGGSLDDPTLIALGEHLEGVLASLGQDCEQLEISCERAAKIAGVDLGNTAAFVEDHGSKVEGPSEGVRLLVTQMAAAGSSIEDIERSLEVTFGVRDAGAAVEAIFGPDSAA